MTELLVSVRSDVEARIALASGAGLIDVKEPSRGSLGRADEDVLAEVLDAVVPARPVSAAMGELRDWPGVAVPPFLDRLTFVKWGLADAMDDWAVRANQLRRCVEERSPCRVVLASYADHARANSPPPREVVGLVAGSVLLLDTFRKDGKSLLHWLSMRDVSEIIASCRKVGTRIALAGSLQETDVEALLPLGPDWVAVRGAVCTNGERGATLDATRVRRLADLVNGAIPAG